MTNWFGWLLFAFVAACALSGVIVLGYELRNLIRTKDPFAILVAIIIAVVLIYVFIEAFHGKPMAEPTWDF